MKLFFTNALKACFRIETRISRILPISCALTMLIGSLGLTPRTSAGKSAGSQAQPFSAIQTQSYEGVITDTHCGAKHSAAIGMAAADCTRVCVHGGEQFALVDGDSVYVLEGGLAALKRVAGQRVRIVGTVNGNTISVASVVPGK
jgi:hypothetical protein